MIGSSWDSDPAFCLWARWGISLGSAREVSMASSVEGGESFHAYSTDSTDFPSLTLRRFLRYQYQYLLYPRIPTTVESSRTQ